MLNFIYNFIGVLYILSIFKKPKLSIKNNIKINISITIQIFLLIIYKYLFYRYIYK